MADQVEFFFDYGSPFSYLADAQLARLRTLGAELRYRPMLLGGLFKATGNHSPMLESVEAKRGYSGTSLRRWAERAGVPFQANPFFPINTLGVMRAAVAAQHLDVFENFHRVVFPAFWAERRNLGDPEVLSTLLEAEGLDARAVAAAASSKGVKDELRATTNEAATRGAFGAPTFFLGTEMYFGNDHLQFLEEALQAQGG